MMNIRDSMEIVQNNKTKDVLRIVDNLVIDVLDAALSHAENVSSASLLNSKLDWFRVEAKHKIRSILSEDYANKNNLETETKGNIKMSNTNRWKPALNGMYYYINCSGGVLPTHWCDDDADRTLYNIGNCFATAKEAKEVADTWKRHLNEYHKSKNLNWSSSSKLMELCTNAFKNIGGLSNTSETVELPDWCKAGAWAYDSNNGYHKIVRIDINGCSVPVIVLDDDNKYTFGSLSWDDVSQARPLPYNKKEMEALVGKVLCRDTDSYLVTSFANGWNQVKIERVWRDASELMRNWTWPDGKPCCKLVHKEGDDWVE